MIITNDNNIYNEVFSHIFKLLDFFLNDNLFIDEFQRLNSGIITNNVQQSSSFGFSYKLYNFSNINFNQGSNNDFLFVQKKEVFQQIK